MPWRWRCGRDHYQAETRLKLERTLRHQPPAFGDYAACRCRRTRPWSGANAFAHEAGIHQDGILKNPLTYQVISPEAVGVPAHRLVLGKHSGRNALRSRLAELGVMLSDDELARCYRLVMALADVKKDDHRRRHAAPGAGGAAADVSAERRAARAFRTWRHEPESWNIAVLPGDGIGPEVIRAAVSVLQDCAREFGFRVNLLEFPFGGIAIDQCGQAAAAGDAGRLPEGRRGAAGRGGRAEVGFAAAGPRPEAGLLALRRALGVYANVRPIRLREPLRALSPLRLGPETTIDFEIIRELVGDIYFGEHTIEGEGADERASDVATLQRAGDRAHHALRVRAGAGAARGG